MTQASLENLLQIKIPSLTLASFTQYEILITFKNFAGVQGS